MKSSWGELDYEAFLREKKNISFTTGFTMEMAQKYIETSSCHQYFGLRGGKIIENPFQK